MKDDAVILCRRKTFQFHQNDDIYIIKCFQFLPKKRSIYRLPINICTRSNFDQSFH